MFSSKRFIPNMKHILNLMNLIACVCCLFGKCKLETEVLGTYSMIDGFKQNHLSQSQQSIKPEKEEQSKQVDPLIETTKLPQISVNRINTLNYNPVMARKIGLSTLMMSGVLYGLTMLPALIAISGAATPFAGLFSSLGRRKRSLVNESHIFRQLPLLDNEETLKFLKLFESTLASRKIESVRCKQFYTCKLYHNVLKSGETPKLSVFESAILNVFGIVAERKDFKIQLIPTVKMYYNVAKDALKGEVCARRYPCSLQAKQSLQTGDRLST